MTRREIADAMEGALEAHATRKRSRFRFSRLVLRAATVLVDICLLGLVIAVAWAGNHIEHLYRTDEFYARFHVEGAVVKLVAFSASGASLLTPLPAPC